MNCLSKFDHFVGLALKGLKSCLNEQKDYERLLSVLLRNGNGMT